MKRQLYWRAVYEDKTELCQYDGDKENKYPDINREKLMRFDLLDYDTNKPVYALWLNEGQRLIFLSIFYSYVKELIDPPQEPYSLTASWVAKNIPPGSSIWVLPDHMAYPLMFHAPESVYA